MAENRKNIRKGGRFCVAGAPNQQSCKNTTFTPGVTMHQFPANPVLREKWIKFVQRHRHDFHEPSKYASLCSAHFEDSCYTRPLAKRLDDLSNVSMNRVLIRGSIPTKDTTVVASSQTLSIRQKRQVCISEAKLGSPKIWACYANLKPSLFTFCKLTIFTVYEYGNFT